MRRSEMHWHIGYTPKRPSCTEKMHYSQLEDAEKAAQEHNRRVVFAEMNVYWCKRHECWHIGHHDKHRLATAKMHEYIKWFQAWEKRN